MAEAVANRRAETLLRLAKYGDFGIRASMPCPYGLNTSHTPKEPRE